MLYLTLSFIKIPQKLTALLRFLKLIPAKGWNIGGFIAIIFIIFWVIFRAAIFSGGQFLLGKINLNII